jgi:hypothetical protein
LTSLKQKGKRAILSLDERMPSVGRPLISILRFLRYVCYYKPIFFLSRWKGSDYDSSKVFWIPPNAVGLYHVPRQNKTDDEGVRFDRVRDTGKVVGGDWDLEVENFDKHPTYGGLRERFVEGKEWADTSVFARAMERIGRGDMVQGSIGTKEKLMDYLTTIDGLYDSIKKLGFRTDSGDTSDDASIKGNQYKSDPYNRSNDNIAVNLDRSGNAIFFDGIHRLSIARILELEAVAVSVMVRHKEWELFRNRLRSHATTQNGRLYQPAYHFDLEDVPYEHTSKDRFDTIRSHMTTCSGSVLDIGANFGYFSHRFEGIGFQCTAVELNPQETYFMKRLKKASEDSFDIYEGSIFDYRSGQVLNVDVVLALNIFHHFLKHEGPYQKLKELLGRLKCKELFLETHNPTEKQMSNAYRNYSPEDFSGFVMEHSRLSGSELVQEMDTGRKLFRLFC